MRLPTRTGLAATAALVALPTVASGALPSGAASPAAPVAPMANSVTYEDSTGEDPAAPDITTIVVSNDDAGIVSFRINVPNRPTFTQDLLFLVFVDTDNNAQTGDPDFLGADYVIQLFQGEASLFRWDGSDFTRRAGDPPATSLVFSYQGGATIRISRNELGNTSRFGFATIAISGITIDSETGDPDFSNTLSDVAPGGGAGLFSYPVIIARPTLVVRRVATAPARPAAGKPFTMRMSVARSDTGAVLRNGRVTCVGRIGTARLRATVARVQGGAVVCTWRIPPAAKGKTFRGQATVVFEGLRATRAISRPIR